MSWMLLIDLFLAAALQASPGLDLPLADAYYPCAKPAACDCPKDSPCKKDCCKDACTCKGAPAQAACAAPVCCPPQAATYDYCLPGQSLMPPGGPRVYEVHLKIGNQECARLMVVAGHVAHVMTGCRVTKDPCVCQVNLHLSDSDDGRVKLRLHALRVNEGAGYPTLTSYHGKKKVHADTVSNVLLGGDDAEPLCAEVLVKAVGPAPMPVPMMAPPAALTFAPCPPCCAESNWCPPATPCVPPMPCPPPMPYAQAQLAVMPPPMPMDPPRVCLPEPMPLPQPVPTVPAVQRCVATVPATAPYSSAHVRLVRCCQKSTLAVKCEGVSARSVRMTIDKGECGSLTVAAGKKYVHVHGKKWKAYADEVEILSDGHVKLKGNVKLVCDKLGVCASVKAKALKVQVKDGQFENIVKH